MTTTLNASTSGGGGLIQTADASGVLALQTAGTTALTIDGSQNVGIGTSSPAGKLTVSGGGSYAPSLSGQMLTLRSGSSWSYMTMGNGDSANSYRYIAAASATQAFGTVTDAGTVTEQVRIDTSGNLLVGLTGASATNAKSWFFDVGQGYQSVNHSTANTTGNYFTGFAYNGSYIGAITQNGTTAVAYNTTSDYRLKENVQPLSGALSRVAALKPCTYTWKSAPDEIGEGFIAHELAEVCPQAVTGEKDAVNEDGSIKPQSIDTSFLVATLTAAIQEQQALITSLTERIAALENK